MGSYRSYKSEPVAEDDAYSSIFKTLTMKQHEVYALVAEGRSSKEIAWRLGISDSAVNQRIEAVRSRAGSPTRAELARAYRRFSAGRNTSAFQSTLTYTADPDSAFLLMPDVASSAELTTACTQTITHTPELASMSEFEARAGLIVPAAFLGDNAGLNRMAAMVVIALGLFASALIGLSVLHALAVML